MNDRPERATFAILPPMGANSVSMGVAAPVGAVSRKDRERAGKTALYQEGPSSLLLLTDLPGSVMLQRRGVDGTWETLDKRPASRSGRTAVQLPDDDAGMQSTYRVVFAPRNTDIASWISRTIDG